MNTIEEYKTELESLNQSIKELKERYQESKWELIDSVNKGNESEFYFRGKFDQVLCTIEDLEELLK